MKKEGKRQTLSLRISRKLLIFSSFHHLLSTAVFTRAVNKRGRDVRTPFPHLAKGMASGKKIVIPNRFWTRPWSNSTDREEKKIFLSSVEQVSESSCELAVRYQEETHWDWACYGLRELGENEPFACFLWVTNHHFYNLHLPRLTSFPLFLFKSLLWPVFSQPINVFSPFSCWFCSNLLPGTSG